MNQWKVTRNRFNSDQLNIEVIISSLTFNYTGFSKSILGGMEASQVAIQVKIYKLNINYFF